MAVNSVFGLIPGPDDALQFGICSARIVLDFRHRDYPHIDQ